MRFIDSSQFEVLGGCGGNGAVTFLKQPHEPLGGPDGGDGGDGGAVLVKASSSSRSLGRVTGKKILKGCDGIGGQKHKMDGAKGRDTVVVVPIGTLVRETLNGSLIADLNLHGVDVVVAKGGVGGKGNSHFTTSSMRTPKLAEGGHTGEAQSILLDYRIPHDISVVGAPNSGKSTLLKILSGSNPSIANYPYTTTEPFSASIKSITHTLAIIEIPGLEADGTGIGAKYLKHLLRTRLVVIVCDATSPVLGQTAQSLRKVIGKFTPKFAETPFLAVISKTDLVDSETLKARRAELANSLRSLCEIYAPEPHAPVEPRNLTALFEKHMLPTAREIGADFPPPVFKPLERFRPKLKFEAPDTVRIVHPRAVRLAAASDLNDVQALAQYRVKLRDFKIAQQLEELRARGVKTVRVAHWELDWS